MDLHGYDFADFGCSDGGSIDWVMKAFDVSQGIGIDKNDAAVEQALRNGYEAVHGDLTNLDFPDDSFRFVVMSHFLEHMPSLDMAKRCVATGVRSSREFVLIRQPWFASDSYLSRLGLKQFWSDWVGHSNRMDLLDFVLVMRELPKPWVWRIYGWKAIVDSSDSSILPLTAPVDQFDYSEDLHGEKPSIRFDEEVFREVFCVAAPDSEHLVSVEQSLPRLTELLDSSLLGF